MSSSSPAPALTLATLRVATRDAGQRKLHQADAQIWALVRRGLDSSPASADALACCANLFVDDLACLVRAAASEPLARICICNAASQSLAHRQALSPCVPVLLAAAADLPKALSCACAVLGEECSGEMQRMLVARCAAPERPGLARFLASCDELCEDALQCMSASLGQDWGAGEVAARLTLEARERVLAAGALASALAALEPERGSERDAALAELACRLLTPCGAGEFATLRGGEAKLVAAAAAASRSIDAAAALERAGAGRGPGVLVWARLRLASLRALCEVSCEAGRARRLCELGLGQVCLDAAREGVDFDVEGARAAATSARNLVLAVPRRAVDLGSLADCAARTVASRDAETASVSAATLRLALRGGSNSEEEERGEALRAWRALVDPRLVVAILRLDLARTHPVARAELARFVALAMALAGSLAGVDPDGEDEPRVACLHTLAALKFASFLLAAPQLSLQVEALDALSALPDALLALCKEPDLEIFAGLLLARRLEEIRGAAGDVPAGAKAAALLQRLG
jgi:hypothetical protein